MELDGVISEARSSGAYAALIDAIPYARLIGMQCEAVGDELLFKLPRNDINLGNPILPALHGGVIGGFMEMAALLHILLVEGSATRPKVVDFSIDYLRPGRDRDTFAQCDVVRKGRSIVNVAIRAWQTQIGEPIATARAHFLLPPGTTG